MNEAHGKLATLATLALCDWIIGFLMKFDTVEESR